MESWFPPSSSFDFFARFFSGVYFPDRGITFFKIERRALDIFFFRWFFASPREPSPSCRPFSLLFFQDARRFSPPSFEPPSPEIGGGLLQFASFPFLFCQSLSLPRRYNFFYDQFFHTLSGRLLFNSLPSFFYLKHISFSRAHLVHPFSALLFRFLSPLLPCPLPSRTNHFLYWSFKEFLFSRPLHFSLL